MNKNDRRSRSALEWKQWLALQAAANILESLANGEKIKGKGKRHKENLAEYSATLRQMLYMIENPEPTLWESFDQAFKNLDRLFEEQFK